jgi:hypothetical protein
VHVHSHESEGSCISVLKLSISPLYTVLIFNFVIVSTMSYYSVILFTFRICLSLIKQSVLYIYCMDRNQTVHQYSCRGGRDRMVVWSTTTYANQCLSQINKGNKKIIELRIESRSWRGVLDTTLCDKVCQWLAAGQWFSMGFLHQ